MKKNKLALALVLTGIFAAGTAHAANDRFIIQVDNNKKGVVKALTKKLGGEIKVDGNGFIAAKFTGQDLSSLKSLLNNPHIKLIEEDHKRVPMSLFNNDVGDAMQQQITPYAVYQSQVDQVTFDANAGMKVCVIDSGLDSSNPDFIWGNITGNWFDNDGPHGTHVAGTIGAADNNLGVVGMALGVAKHIIKVFNESGWGYSSDLAQAADLCSQAGANIISMSLGGGGSNSTESNAFANFTNAGGLVVAAAGNNGWC